MLKSQSDTFQNNNIKRTSEFKRDVAYGQDCDDTEYRNEWGTPNWKNYGRWLSECDSIRTVTLDKEFAERRKKQQREQAIKDSIEALEYENIDLDLSASGAGSVMSQKVSPHIMINLGLNYRFTSKEESVVVSSTPPVTTGVSFTGVIVMVIVEVLLSSDPSLAL